LTEREHAVLQALVKGLSYKQVALQLDISIDTVRTHIRAVYRKLQVHSVAEAVARAIREKLV
jgi:DNA-binding NarL/FixJ family response regulator